MLAPQRFVQCATALLACLLASSTAHAGWWSFGDDCPESPLARYERAGRPQEISRLARLSAGPKYDGYYVGGRAALRGDGKLGGDPRYCHEGTWGWDYAPRYSLVKLWWFHGRRYQGGEGQYEPDHHNNPFDHFWGE